MISILLLLPTLLLLIILYQRLKPLPAGINLAGRRHPATALRFLADTTFIDADNTLSSDQQIFDAFFAAINNARRFILIDVFLYNSFKGRADREARPLADELTACLLARKQRFPTMTIIVITDPINTVYNSLPSPHFARLQAAGITVVSTDLNRLRDSNPLYSCCWHLFCRPWSTGPGHLAANPFAPGRISLRSLLALLNFKANHRKVLIADSNDALLGLVTSGNPHGASSSHTNVALAFSGPAVLDLLACEEAVLSFSGGPQLLLPPELLLPDSPPETVTVQILTEGAIKEAALAAINQAGAGDKIDLLLFYLSDRQCIRALKGAQQRGAAIRLLLDPNKDAFGRTRTGLPNRQVGDELHRAGVSVRWAATHGEQCHAKLLMVSGAAKPAMLLLGSANFTRRNLDNFNLETDVAVRGAAEDKVFTDAGRFFDTLWHNQQQRQYTLEFGAFADPSLRRKLLYRFLEATGLCTF